MVKCNYNFKSLNELLVLGVEFMNLPEKKFITIDEFYKMKEETDDILEYIDGVVYMSPSPSTKHQRISGRLYVKLFNF